MPRPRLADTSQIENLQAQINALGGGGSRGSQILIPFATTDIANMVWTNQPVALSFWMSSATSGKGVIRVDLTNYTQVRLMVNKLNTAGATDSKLILRYKTGSWSTAVADYLNIGVSEVSVPINVQNTFLETSWIDLVPEAKADVLITLLGSGGDGVIDPIFGYIAATFK